jgi:hypothetical protein
VGASKVRITVKLFSGNGQGPIEFTQEAQTQIGAPVVVMDFGQIVSAKMIQLEVLLLEDSEFGHVHIWDIEFR